MRSAAALKQAAKDIAERSLGAVTRQNLWLALGDVLTQKTKSLAHSNAALQKEATDLVDHSRSLAD